MEEWSLQRWDNRLQQERHWKRWVGGWYEGGWEGGMRVGGRGCEDCWVEES